MNNSISRSLYWKLLERFGVGGIQFVLQLVLARLLTPEHYGVLAIMVIFTTLANVFIQNGFNTALIQNKNVTDEDYSSVLWITLGIASVFYAIIYAVAPLIARFYDMPEIIKPLRVLALMLFPGALNSIQIAKVSREMDFRKVFSSGILGVAISGLAGIILAYMGAGLWALVAQSILNVTVSCLVMLHTVAWKPRLVCNLQRIKKLFSFGWKYLTSGLMDTLFNDLWDLVVGKKFNSRVLGYYNRGNQFPNYFLVAIMGAAQSVMLPAMSAKQDDVSEVKRLAKDAISLTAYIIFPMMAGIAGVGASLVQVLLTDKWLPCVPYLQIACFGLAFLPLDILNLQAISAMGRSDIFLKLEVIKKVFCFSMLAFALFYVRTAIQIALIDAVCCVFALFVNSYPNKNLIGYSWREQFKDISSSLAASLAMLGVVLAIGQLPLAPLPLLVLQVLVGIALYLGISIVTRMRPYVVLSAALAGFFRKDQSV